MKQRLAKRLLLIHTLTPGTISVEHEGDEIWVHSLSYSDDDLDSLADMDARVSNIESAA